MAKGKETTRKKLYTEEGYKSLVDEYEYLKNIRRQEVKDTLAQARSYGDLSENSEYDEAKNEQAKVEARINELEELIRSAQVVTEKDIDADTVHVGACVRVYDMTYDEEIEYNIVGSNEANPLLGNISDQSPIGSALLGARRGDIVSVDTPGGELKLKIIDISRSKS
ncbi:MAG TPA: transcription elongation factor GreA [Bacillota bacterium]|nr:transcription elongation factor GreA [Bacillota bacterium]